jgi:hypothetical protein
MFQSFQSLQPAVRKAAVCAALVVLAGGGAAGGVAAASASVKPATSPPLSHQLCYLAHGTGFTIPASVTLSNALNPAGFTPTIGTTAYHCNPVAKTLPTGKVFPITNPAGHLACLSITAPAQTVHSLAVTNQFGIADVTTGQPNLLCLPSWKSLTGPPRHKPVQPPGLDHFTCYPVTISQGAYHPPAVMLQDEFTTKPVEARVSAVPSELCMPTKKVVGGTTYPIIHPAGSLLCFPVSATPHPKAVYDQNQFGTAKLAIGPTHWLCPPSTWHINF